MTLLLRLLSRISPIGNPQVLKICLEMWELIYLVSKCILLEQRFREKK